MCIRDSNKELFKAGTPPPISLPLENEESLKHLREDGFKGSQQRQIRLIKSATFRVHPRPGVPNLLMNGYLRIVDVPGLGAGMRLHEAITLEEMKREDAMIVLVTDAGRQRVDEMKSLSACLLYTSLPAHTPPPPPPAARWPRRRSSRC